MLAFFTHTNTGCGSCRKGSSVRVYWCTAATGDVLNVEFGPGLPQR